ncbi:MAG: phospholipid-binding protein [Candidatus Marinimicrobia bacterium]|nr:phospholipid-binding protein [Candidatus Neomarinimicrobiota bacterium]RPG05982.1 MAG: BON domain-containing protein [Pelagibacteraceae bacterium TMED247]|tara:strand:- start:2249 stop:2836 length:588 start_codon:yes stop_codon:yes gene_type:complete
MKKILLIIVLFFLNSCVGSSSVGIFGSGVSIAYDPRTVGMQIDDSIMQKNLSARLALTEKKYLVYLSIKVLDGNIFLTGKVDEPEEKLKIIKMAWETKGVRSVKTAITIKGETNFKNSTKDALITTQLRTAMIFKKDIKATNYNIDTINGKIYIFGIAMKQEEKRNVIEEAKQIYGVKEVIPSIILVEDLSRNKN